MLCLTCFLILFEFGNITAESDHESTESDEEFQICEICSAEEVIAIEL